MARLFPTARLTRWRTCRGLQLGFGRRSVEFWYLPARTVVPKHVHGFFSWFVLLFGAGAEIGRGQQSGSWELFRVHEVPAGVVHWLYAPRALLFVSYQEHKDTVVSASEDFVYDIG